MDAKDREVLTAQLHRPPRGVLSIEARCPTGHPQVIKVYPLLKEGGKVEPFPTIFWLSCPHLREKISALERQAWIQKLEAKLTLEESLRRELTLNHQSYIAERWGLLTEKDKNWLTQQGWEPLFFNRGIGGIENWNHLKCLHLHFAHHLARQNVIGEILHQKFNLQPCTTGL